MEYKTYLHEEAPVPIATKRRWTQNTIGAKKRRSYKTWLIPDAVKENISNDDSGDNVSKCNLNSPDVHGNFSADDDNEVVSDADENFTDADDCFSADEEDDFFSTANENFPETHNVKQFNGEHGCNWCYQKGEVVEKAHIRWADVVPIYKIPIVRRPAQRCVTANRKKSPSTSARSSQICSRGPTFVATDLLPH
ncbi:hypothetical protein QQF64_023737 [Cirrhinus molitorella]|uniref:Uncharacterized protein n=1 Tax=Cirrhinus molitorella TaxID=172907 RepID=A0ABR3NJA9_9TELE